MNDQRILTRFTPLTIGVTAPADCLVALFVDVESTGLDHETDKITELAMKPFAFDKDGIIRGVGKGVDYLNDPGMPIPPEIVEKTGITDEMVKGQAIDMKAVQDQLGMAQLVIAHNAGFDRKMAEAAMPGFAKIRWACSWKEVAWKRLFGASCGHLGHLLMDMHDQFFVAHRALMDCEAAIYLLGETKDADGRTALSHLYESMKKPTYRVWANDAPFSLKDTIKKRRVDGERYKWHPGESGHAKAWYFDGGLDAANAEIEWLKSKRVRATTEKFTALERYSLRTEP